MIRILAITLFLSAIAHAQAPQKTSASFYCFRYADELEDVFVRTGAEVYQKVELSTANMLGPLEVVISEGSVFVHREDTDAEGKTIYPPVGKISLRGIDKPLIVLFPGKEADPLPYRGVTIDRDNAKFPMGSYQFMNLSPYAMRGLVGKVRIDAKPGEVTNLKPQGEPGQMQQVTFEYLDGEIWKTMTKTRWAVRDDRRNLMCAYLDPKSQRVKLRSIPERMVSVASRPGNP
ncbi:hypothetical protein [Haloferula rosea]|uniref:DUF3108 domain-containing protein n=1 Tax=Haloferula rosea TaxID=490093 RepID=A0A934RC70_9BACT|nr:hypothetical protein [Haloferula rosea]MBK1825780.1 hypothetical protein [Haloferula rosea]